MLRLKLKQKGCNSGNKMDKETIIITLRLIIARSGDASKEAVTAIRALKANSHIIQIRLNRVAELALNDHLCDWSSDEREMIAGLLQAEDSRRTKMLPIRLSEQEHAELGRLADEAGQTMADYIRGKVFSNG